MNQFTVSLFIGCFLSAALSADNHQLGLNNFLGDVLRDDPRIIAARLSAEADNAATSASGYLPDPGLNIMVETMDGFDRLGKKGLTLTQMFPGRGKRAAELTIARLTEDASLISVQARQQAIVSEAALRFHAALSLQEQLGLLDDTRELVQQLVEIARTRAEAGGSVRELLQLEMELLRLDDEIANQRARSQGTIASLAVFTGKTYHNEVTLVADRRAAFSDPENIGTHPQVLAAGKQSEALREQLSATRLASRPDFMIGVGFTQEDEMMAGGVRTTNDMWSLMVGVTLPVWRERYQAQGREAQARLRAQEQETSALIRELQSLTSTLLSRRNFLQSSLERYEGKLIPYANDIISISLEDYRNNALSVFELINNQRELLTLKREAVMTYHELQSVQWELWSLSGNPQPSLSKLSESQYKEDNSHE